MMNVIKIILTAVVMFSSVAFAADTAEAKNSKQLTAHETVIDTTNRVMSIILAAQQYYDEDPDRFYVEVESVLDDIVDFDSFAWGVMGEYASKSTYSKLPNAEAKKAFRERMKRFSQVFRAGLVQTYAKGLLAFDGNKIEVLEPGAEFDAESDDGDSVTVVQHIYGESEKPYVVQYKMKQDRRGDWKLRNVTIEGVNLGKVYVSQFASAAKQYNQDIDKVIDNWSVDPSSAQ
jgi:phospholipid transport system substrate-binding protein